MATSNKNSFPRFGKIVLLLSIGCALFWISAQMKPIYRSAGGVRFLEILWLPMQILLAAIPLIAILFFILEKFKLRSLFLYALLIWIGTVLYLLLG